MTAHTDEKSSSEHSPDNESWIHDGACTKLWVLHTVAARDRRPTEFLRFGSADADSALLLTKISIITPTCSKLVLSPCNLV